MYSSRQRDLRERRSHQQWDARGAADQTATSEADEGRELEAQSGWSMQLSARAGAA